MTDKDNSPKEALQTKLFSMGQDTEKAIEAHYTAIGKIVYSHTKELSLEEVYGRDTNAIKQLAAERELIRWFEGQKNGLSMASNEDRQMIPDKDKLEKHAKLGKQLANWVHNSGYTKEEFDELKTLADKILKEME